MEQEIWKDIPGWEGRYAASTFGRVKTYGFNRILNNAKICSPEAILRPGRRNAKSPYLKVTFSRDGVMYRFWVHRLVAKCFIENYSESLCVYHLDCDPTNNHVSNLEMVTHQQNIAHAVKMKRMIGKPVKVIDIGTGIKYDSIKLAWRANSLGFKYNYFANMVDGSRRNKTSIQKV